MNINTLDQIVIHLKSRYELGQRLSEFYVETFTVDGVVFEHLLGYAMWVTTGRKYDQFKTYSPYVCLELYKEVPKVWVKDFKEIYYKAMKARLMSFTGLVDDFKGSTMAFVDGNTKGRFKTAELYERLRDELNES